MIFICPVHKVITYTAGTASTMHWTGEGFCSQFKKDSVLDPDDPVGVVAE